MNKKIYKSREDRAISGVCAGLAEYFDIDVVIVRLLMVIFCFISFGVALVAYIVAAVIIPEEPTVRMNDGSRRPVYETTYEDWTENGQAQAAGAEFYTGGEGACGCGGQTGGPANEGMSGNAGPEAGAEGEGNFRSENAGTAYHGPEGGQRFGAQMNDASFQKKEPAPQRKSSGSWIVGLLLIALGSYLILDWFFPWVSWRLFGALIMIVLGFVFLLKR